MKKVNINQTRLESIPYQALFNKRIQLEKWANLSIWGAAALSILVSLLNPEKQLATAIILLNWLVMLVGLLLHWYASLSLGPAADQERIAGFMDNAFETKIQEKPVGFDYYSNGGVEKGIKRLAANSFENSFFTDRISAEMTKRIMIKNLVFILFFIIFMVFNLKSSHLLTNFTALFQLLVSSTLLEELFRHLAFRKSIHEVFERFKMIYDNISYEDENFQAQIIYTQNTYERALAYYNQPLDSRIFSKLNPKLSLEWEEMKKRYKI